MEPLTRETARETQAAIEQLLGLSRQTLRASAFLAQGDGAAFTEAEPRERKQILAECLGLELWDRLLALARRDRAALEQELSRLAGRLETIEAELELSGDVERERDSHLLALEEARRSLAAHEQRLTELDATLAAARESAAARAAAERLVAAAAQALADSSQRLRDLADEEMDIREALLDRDRLAGQASRVAELEQLREQTAQAQADYRELVRARRETERTVTEARAAWEKALRQADRLYEQAHDLRLEAAAKEGEEDATCQTCGQPIHGDAKQRAIAELLRLAQEAHDEAGRHQEAAAAAARIAEDGGRTLAQPAPAPPAPLEPIDQELRAARAAATALAALAERERRLAQILAEARDLLERLPALECERDAAQAELDRLGPPVDPQPLERERESAEARRAARERDVLELERAAARCQERIDRLAQLREQHDVDAREAEHLGEEAQVLAQLERAFGRDGIPALIIEAAAIPQIETEANRILAELGTGYRVELRTQRALKSGDGLREALDIVVYAPGGEALYEDFSGGERTRLNLALRIALARLLAHRRGAEVRMLAIDEPEFLDEQGMDALARVLRGLAADFDRIVVISHVPALREAFDQVIEVARDEDGVSRLAPALAEAVVA